MSWNKNTTTSTKIDDTIEVLRENDISYTLEILGEVQARGSNDSYTGTEYYSIRKLSYKDYVIIEQMVRHPDCDIDDCIIVENFAKEHEPENWEIDVEIDELSGDFIDITEEGE